MSKELNLFPLHGIELGKTSLAEVFQKYGKEKMMADSRDSSVPLGLFAVKLEGICFVLCGKSPTAHVVTKVIIDNATALPKEWIAHGMHWDMCWEEWVAFFEKTNGNYNVKDLVKTNIEGTLTSVAKLSSGLYYQLKLDFFGEMGSTTKTKNTLKSIEIKANNYAGKDKGFEDIYKGKSAPAKQKKASDSSSVESDSESESD